MKRKITNLIGTIFRKEIIGQVFCLLFVFGFAQSVYAQRIVSGTVTAQEDGSGLPGVNVTIKGTSQGTATDADGKFSLNVPDGATLVFSFVGFNSKEVVVGAQSTIDVALETDIKALSEVVVIGYGTAQKKDLTGSVTKVSSADFNPGPIVNPLQQLTGRAAGVTVTQVGSEPGTSPSVRIRGITSLIGGNDPLVVVDGIQGNLDMLRQIPPSEIESYDVLKDASATAIYGSRGAAGVIIISTKKGKEGKTTIEYNNVFSYEVISKKYDMLSADGWRQAAQQRGIASSADKGGNTNWFDAITRTGFTQTHNLAFGGGTKGFNYRASLTAIDQKGVIIGSNAKNYIGRLNATQKGLNDKLTLTYNLNLSLRENRYNNGDVVGLALSRRPTDPTYNAEGKYFTDSDIFGYTNPYARAAEIIDGDKQNDMFASMKAEYEIIDGLTAGVFGSWRKTDRLYGRYESPLTTMQDARSQSGIARRETNTGDESLFDFIVNYNKIMGDHSFGATFVYEWQKQTYEGYRAIGRGFVNDLLTFNALQSADLTKAQAGDIRSYKNDRTITSFLGRINYAYKDKYLITASIRRDGSSVFGANNKWGNFPSVSAAWRVSNEDFLKDNKYISDLKVRVGFGVTGNQQGLSPLGSVRLVSPDGTAFFGGALIPNFAISQNANPDLRWETREMFNAGIDFGFFDNKLTGTIDYYNGVTKNLLFDYVVPQPPYPFGTIKANVGKVKNTGFEVTLNYLLIEQEDLKVSIGGNFTRNRNIVQELSGSLGGVPLNTDLVRWGGGGTTGVASTNNAIQYLMVGQPIGTFYLFKHAGVDEQGNQIMTDLNGNGVIDDGDRSADRYVAGNALPKFSYAFTPSVSYKNFDVSLVLRGVAGNKVYNATRAQLSALSQIGQSNVLQEAVGAGIRNISYASDYWLESGSFARLENLTVGYRINTENWKVIDNLRLSVTANNLFIITKYKGIDPELSSSGSSNDGRGFGTDFGIYPRTRNFSVGLSVTFK